MVDFKVRRGPSTTVFSAPGVINKKLVIEEGCWYLCTDTAELFLGVLTEDNSYTLKRINDVRSEVSDEKLQAALEELKNSVTELEDLELFKKIQNESELPKDFESDSFNPNVTYFIPLGDGRVSTYIFDKGASCYLCTNSVDELIIRTMITAEIESALDDVLDAKIPKAIIDTIEGTILHGGDATPEDD